MTCQEVVELVTAYLDGTMSTEDRAVFEEHLALCDGCDRYLAQMRTTIALVGQVREETLSPRVRQQLLDAFAEWKNTGTSPDPS
jgi:anti-sigma factor RsiW